MSVISQYYSVILDRGISARGNNKEVVDGLNDISKIYLYQAIGFDKTIIHHMIHNIYCILNNI